MDNFNLKKYLAEGRKDLYKGGLSDRIEGLLNQPMKKKFLDMGMDLIQDLLEEDPFEIDDVVNHLAAELGKYYDDFLGAGERLAGGESPKYIDESIDDESSEFYFDYLNKLRDSGKTNMFGAAPYLRAEFGLDKRTAREILAKWMKSSS